MTDIMYNVFFQYASFTVAIERAAAVIVAMTRSKTRVEWEQRVRRVTKTLDQENPRIRVLQQLYDREQGRIHTLTKKNLMARIDPVENEDSQDEYIGYLTAVKFSYEFQLARFQSISQRYTSIGVLVAGIILAVFGLSIFDSFFVSVYTQDMPRSQFLGLRFADIVITGGLLGGGSAGLSTTFEKVGAWRNRE